MSISWSSLKSAAIIPVMIMSSFSYFLCESQVWCHNSKHIQVPKHLILTNSLWQIPILIKFGAIQIYTRFHWISSLFKPALNIIIRSNINENRVIKYLFIGAILYYSCFGTEVKLINILDLPANTPDTRVASRGVLVLGWIWENNSYRRPSDAIAYRTRGRGNMAPNILGTFISHYLLQNRCL